MTWQTVAASVSLSQCLSESGKHLSVVGTESERRARQTADACIYIEFFDWVSTQG